MRKLLITALLLMSTLVYAGDAGYVKQVKESVLRSYDSTTVGQAFDAYFKDSYWASVTEANGTVKVNFTGTFDQKKINNYKKGFTAGDELAWAFIEECFTGKMHVQFILNASKTGYTTKFISKGAYCPDAYDELLLDMIYE